MDIEKLKEEEKHLKNLLQTNRDAQRKWNEQVFLSKYNLAMSDKITFMDGSTQKWGTLCGFRYSYGNEPYPIVKLFKKDGSQGNRETYLYTSMLSTIKKV